MGSLIGRFKPGQNVPVFANAQINAGHFVKIVDAAGAGDAPLTAYPAEHCGAGERVFGVAEADSGPITHDAHAQTRMVNVARGGIARVVAGAAVAATVDVGSDATGRAVAGVDPVGQALTAAAQAGDIIEVALF
jgi:hypothetical protein